MAPTTTYTYREESGYSVDLKAGSMDEALEKAEALLRDGEWGDYSGWVHAWVVATEVDEDGDEVDSWQDSASVLIEPEEPACPSGAHDWTGEGEGGLDENPGVWSVGGAAILTSRHCRHCGLVRRTISGDTNAPGAGNRDGTTYRTAEDWCPECQHDGCVCEDDPAD